VIIIIINIVIPGLGLTPLIQDRTFPPQRLRLLLLLFAVLRLRSSLALLGCFNASPFPAIMNCTPLLLLLGAHSLTLRLRLRGLPRQNLLLLLVG